MLRSIERLKEELSHVAQVCHGESIDKCKEIADEIESEVEERYVELPRDKSGVPIHLGDKVRTKLDSIYAVSRITREDYKGTTTWYIEDFASNFSLGPEDLTLCKPPAIEDVLFGLLEKAVGHNAAHTELTQDMVEDFAKRLQLKDES